MKFPFFASFILFGIWLTFALFRSRSRDQKADDEFWKKEALADNTRRQPLDNLAYVHIPYEALPFDLLPGAEAPAPSKTADEHASPEPADGHAPSGTADEHASPEPADGHTPSKTADEYTSPEPAGGHTPSGTADEHASPEPADGHAPSGTADELSVIAAQIADCHRILNGFREKKAVNLTGITNTDLKLTYGAANITLLMEYDQNYTLLVRTMQKWADLLIRAGYRREAVPILEFCVETRTDISSTYRALAAIYRERGETDKIAHLREVADGLNSAMRPAILRMLDKISNAQ